MRFCSVTCNGEKGRASRLHSSHLQEQVFRMKSVAQPEANHLMGMFSPRTGAPSMISYFASVSLSFLAEVPVPVCSRRLISISMCFSFIRTCILSRLSQEKIREHCVCHSTADDWSLPG